jgi:hypothetical protein
VAHIVNRQLLIFYSADSPSNGTWGCSVPNGFCTRWPVGRAVGCLAATDSRPLHRSALAGEVPIRAGLPDSAPGIETKVIDHEQTR